MKNGKVVVMPFLRLGKRSDYSWEGLSFGHDESNIQR